MRARIVKVSDLKSVRGEEWVDEKMRPYVKGDTAWVGVKEGYAYDCVLEKEKHITHGYHQVEDVLLIHGDRPTDSEIAQLVDEKNPACIIHIKGYNGIMRIPDTEVLYGESKEVCFKENGIWYIFDPTRVMFAMGNRNEKRRMTELIKPNERVADMFAGIGYFTLSAAAAGANVHSMEINPESFAYLLRNIVKNNFSSRVDAECGDCRRLLKGNYDRALMGHFDSPDMIEDVMPYMNKSSILHIHSINNNLSEMIISAVCKSGRDCECVSMHKVKKYAPHKEHVVYDVKLA